MADAGKTHVGSGAQGKRAGAGATTDLPADLVEGNTVRSDRDKSLHTEARGRDGKDRQVNQFQETATKRDERLPVEGEGVGD